MNLHSIASGVIGAVNPMTTVTVQQSNGYTTAADGTQVPAYATSTAQAQIQALSGKDLQQMQGLNIQGELRALYIQGDLQGLVRPLGHGGDLVLRGSEVWKVVQVLETWPDWCKVVVCLQR